MSEFQGLEVGDKFQVSGPAGRYRTKTQKEILTFQVIDKVEKYKPNGTPDSDYVAVELGLDMDFYREHGGSWFSDVAFIDLHERGYLNVLDDEDTTKTQGGIDEQQSTNGGSSSSLFE